MQLGDPQEQGSLSSPSDRTNLRDAGRQRRAGAAIVICTATAGPSSTTLQADMQQHGSPIVVRQLLADLDVVPGEEDKALLPAHIQDLAVQARRAGVVLQGMQSEGGWLNSSTHVQCRRPAAPATLHASRSRRLPPSPTHREPADAAS